MANKKAILEQLANFFAEQGKVLTPSEYKSMGNDDVPMRFMVAKRPFGSWSRMTQLLKVNFPDQWAKANKEVATPAKAEVKAAPKTAKAAPKKAKE